MCPCRFRLSWIIKLIYPNKWLRVIHYIKKNMFSKHFNASYSVICCLLWIKYFHTSWNSHRTLSLHCTLLMKTLVSSNLLVFWKMLSNFSDVEKKWTVTSFWHHNNYFIRLLFYFIFLIKVLQISWIFFKVFELVLIKYLWELRANMNCSICQYCSLIL